MHRHMTAGSVVPLSHYRKILAELHKLPSSAIQLTVQVIIRAINVSNVNFLVSSRPHVKYFKLKAII